jgi:hypothetical protein
VLLTVAGLGISGLVFVYVSIRLDNSDSTKTHAEAAGRGMGRVSMRGKGLDTKSGTSRKTFVNRHSRVIGSIEQQTLDASLPSILRPIPVWRKFSNEVQMHHRWIGVFCYYSPTYSRPVRVLSLLLNIVTMLFLEAVTYDLADPDDGSCERMKTRPDCLREQSSLANTNKCYWDPTNSSCQIRPIDNDFLRVMIVALFAALISTPFALTFQSLIMFVLAGQTIDKSDTNQVSSTKSMSSISTSVSRIPSSLFVEQDIFRRLITEITKYRSHLSDVKREEFDMIWGLDFSALEASQNHTVMQQIKSWRSHLLTYFGFGEVPQEVKIMKELDLVRETTMKELEFFGNPWVNELEKRQRLIFLFVKDLLNGINGNILDIKDRLDNSKKLKVTYESKVLTSLFLFVMSFGMLFYVYLFAMRQTSNRQNAWFNSFITWLIFEICLVSSMMVFTQHVLIPLYILSDVKRVKQQVMRDITLFRSKMKQSLVRARQSNPSSAVRKFNAAEYFFVSSRIAQTHPELGESTIISEYATIWPKKTFSSNKNSKVQSSYDMRFKFLTQAVSRVALFALTSLIHLPEPVRELSLRLFATGGLGYVAILFHRLFLINPFLPLLPAVVILFVLYVMFLSGGSHLSLAMTYPIEEDESLRNEDEWDQDKKMTTVDPPLSTPTETHPPIDFPRESQLEGINHSTGEGIALTRRMVNQIENDPLENESLVSDIDKSSSSPNSSVENFDALISSVLMQDFWFSSSSPEQSQVDGSKIPSVELVGWDDSSSEDFESDENH